MDLLERVGDLPIRHPWETARLDAVARLVADAGAAEGRVLDVGCGDGFVLRALQERFHFRRAAGLDLHFDDSQTGIDAGAAVEFHRAFASGDTDRFDLALLLDVLEHVPDPVAFLREIVGERVEPGGVAVLTAPAFQSLYSQHDRALRHHRRYARRQLVKTAESAGLTVLDSGYFFCSLLLPRALGVLAERMGLRSGGRAEDGSEGVGGWSGGALASRALESVLTLDARICIAAARAGVRIPGLSVWATGTKPRS